MGKHSESNLNVNAHNEWDLLKEVIVGRLEGAHVPDEPTQMIQATAPENQWSFFKNNAGKPFPEKQIEAGIGELDEFVHILEAEGVRVERPEDPKDLFSKPIVGKDWKTSGGFYSAMPRDNLMTVGNIIIEAPMAWRSRQNEGVPYRKLLNEYKLRGAKHVQTPRPALSQIFYRKDWKYTDAEFVSVINNTEPTFDAADFIRFGREIVGQISHVTNSKGVELLRGILGSDYKIHIIQFQDTHPMHIDATLVPLRPGLALINPERVPPKLQKELKSKLFKGWDLIEAPQPIIPDEHPLYLTSKWINMNILSLDQERVVVEAQDEPIIKLFKDLGLKPIKCNFRNFNSFGGSFHCATCDVVRESKLESYLG